MTDKEIKQKYDDSIGEGQQYYNGQSKNVSDSSRAIVFSMIATIWLVSYEDGAINRPHLILCISLLLCFIYLFLDITLYFINARFYHNQTISLEKHFGNEYYLKKTYNKQMITYSKKAYRWMCVKYSLFVVTALFFLAGTYLQLV